MATHLKNLSDFSHLETPSAQPFRFSIIVAQWNIEVTSALYHGAHKVLKQYGALTENIQSIYVPGSYELISGASMVLNSQHVDAVICLGSVIQGETRHFDFICQAVANGLADVSIKYNKPVIFGLLTTDTLQQAIERAGGKHGNKGEEAAIAAIQMAYIQKNVAH